MFEKNQLQSSKDSQFNIFKEAVELFLNKRLNKEKIINLHNKIKVTINLPLDPCFNITDSWLLGFIEGDGCFSTSKLRPRLRFENNFKEEKLFKAIKSYIAGGSLVIQKRAARGLNEAPTVILDIAKICLLKTSILSRYSVADFLTKKKLDYSYWCMIVNLNCLGYHLIPAGQKLINVIKSGMNNYRLSTYKNAPLQAAK